MEFTGPSSLSLVQPCLSASAYCTCASLSASLQFFGITLSHIIRLRKKLERMCIYNGFYGNYHALRRKIAAAYLF